MGGWCTLRDHCPHYHSEDYGKRPSERLCIPGCDGVSDAVSLRLRPKAPVVLVPLKEARKFVEVAAA
jgi:hypothetical protein